MNERTKLMGTKRDGRALSFCGLLITISSVIFSHVFVGSFLRVKVETIFHCNANMRLGICKEDLLGTANI